MKIAICEDRAGDRHRLLSLVQECCKARSLDVKAFNYEKDDTLVPIRRESRAEARRRYEDYTFGAMRVKPFYTASATHPNIPTTP